MIEPMCICYHGTTKENAHSIAKDGFRAGTYFATHLEDAIAFGGPWVLEAAFPKSAVPDYWEFIISEVVPPERIVAISRHDVTMLYLNEELQDEVFRSNGGEPD